MAIVRQSSFIEGMDYSLEGSTFGQFWDEHYDDLLPERENSIFDESPYRVLALERNPHQRGKMGEEMVKVLAVKMGFDKDKSVPGDVWVNGIDLEVKFARESEKGEWTINQVRPKQDYEYVVIIALRPKRYDAWIFTIPKEVIIKHSTGQHGGKDAVETMICKKGGFEKLARAFSQYEGLEVFRSTMEKGPRNGG